MDIQLINLSANSGLESEPAESPLIQGDQPVEDDQRIRTRLLTYLRQNYLRIFTILVAIILFLSLTVALLIIIEFRKTNQLSDSESIIIVPQEDSTTRISSGIEDDYEFVGGISTTVQVVTEEHTLSRKISCNRIKCQPTSCMPQDVLYVTMREYACCSCYPERFTFRRFQYNVISGRTSLIFQVPEVISQYSVYDLRAMAKLPGLLGTWNMVQESETAYYLVYESVSPLPPPPDDVRSQ